MTTTPATQALLPCPFGHPFVAKYPRSAVQRVVWARGLADRYKVMCECGAEGPYGDTQDEALTAWNTRQAHSLPGDVGVMVPRNPTDDMVQAGLYQLSVGGDEWAMIYQIWTDMFTTLTMDGGCIDSLPAEPVQVADQILWHVEQVCGPLSTEAVENPGDDDRSVLLHNIRAALTPSALSGDAGEGEDRISLSEYESEDLDEMISVALIMKTDHYDTLWNLRNRIKPFVEGDEHFDPEFPCAGDEQP